MTFLNPDARSEKVTCACCDRVAVRCCTACGAFGCEQHVPAGERAICRGCRGKQRRKAAAVLLACGAVVGLLLLAAQLLR